MRRRRWRHANGLSASWTSSHWWTWWTERIPPNICYRRRCSWYTRQTISTVREQTCMEKIHTIITLKWKIHKVYHLITGTQRSIGRNRTGCRSRSVNRRHRNSQRTDVPVASQFVIMTFFFHFQTYKNKRKMKIFNYSKRKEYLVLTWILILTGVDRELRDAPFPSEAAVGVWDFLLEYAFLLEHNGPFFPLL